MKKKSPPKKAQAAKRGLFSKTRLFMKEPWDKETYIPIKLRGMVDLVRPFTLLAPLIGGLCAALMAARHSNYENFDFLQLIYGVGTLVIINAASNTLNQVSDLKIDEINKPYRPIPSGIVSEGEALVIAGLLYFAALFRAFLVGPVFFGFAALIVAITIGYSLPPLRFKNILWVSNATIALARGLLGFVAAWCIFGYAWAPLPWVLGFIMFLYLLGAVSTKDYTDIKGDAKYGAMTPPVVYGIKKSTFFILPFFVFPFILIPFAAAEGLLKPESIILAAILIIWGLYTAALLWRYATTPDSKFENTPAWRHMYLILIAFQAGFFIIYMV